MLTTSYKVFNTAGQDSMNYILIDVIKQKYNLIIMVNKKHVKELDLVR